MLVTELFPTPSGRLRFKLCGSAARKSTYYLLDLTNINEAARLLNPLYVSAFNCYCFLVKMTEKLSIQSTGRPNGRYSTNFNLFKKLQKL